MRPADAGVLGLDLAAGIRPGKGDAKLGVRVGNWLTAEQGNLSSGYSAVRPFLELKTTPWVTVLLAADYDGLQRPHSPFSV